VQIPRRVFLNIAFTTTGLFFSTTAVPFDLVHGVAAYSFRTDMIRSQPDKSSALRSFATILHGKHHDEA
jgi:hypothetical protein